jgi:hypothetical protein
MRQLISQMKVPQKKTPSAAASRDTSVAVEDWMASMMKIPLHPSGTAALTVPRVLVQAYTLDQRLGIFLINLHSSQSIHVTVPVNPKQYRLPDAKYGIEIVRAAGREPASLDSGGVAIDLPPREFFLIEAKE